MHTEFDSKLPLVPCLPGDFNQVILNIVVNAAHAIADVVDNGGDKGNITISTEQVDGWVEIRISDTGIGMPDDVQTKIFDPFFTTKEVGRGTGQGLSMAYAVIVEKHGGTIDVKSRPDHGTTFRIRLPMIDDDTELQENAA